MSNDKIKFYSETYDSISQELLSVVDCLDSVISTLSGISTSEDWWDKIHSSGSIKLKLGGSYSFNSASQAVKQIRRAADRCAGNTQDLASAVTKAKMLFENAEAAAVARGTNLSTASQADVYQDGDTNASIRSRQSLENEYRAQWEKEDAFIDTEYDQKIKQGLENLLLNDDRFSKSKWNGASVEERKKTLEAFNKEIQKLYGTTLDGGLNWYSEERSSSGLITCGYYSSGKDGIWLNEEYFKNANLADMIGLMCHENRHNLQHEIMNAYKNGDVSKYSGTDDADKTAVETAAKAWINNQNNYISSGSDAGKKLHEKVKSEFIDEQLGKKTNNYEKTMTIIETLAPILPTQISTTAAAFNTWAYDQEKQRIVREAQDYADEVVWETYLGQQNEVDARYIEHYAEDLVNSQPNAPGVGGGALLGDFPKLGNGIASVPFSL